MKKTIAILTLIFTLASCGPTIPTTTVLSTTASTVSAIDLGDLREGHGSIYKITIDSVEYILFYDYDNSSITKHRDLRNAGK